MSFNFTIPSLFSDAEYNIASNAKTFLNIWKKDYSGYYIVKATRKLSKDLPLLLQNRDESIHLTFYKHTGEIFEEISLEEEIVRHVKEHVKTIKFGHEVFFKIFVEDGFQ